MKILFLGGSMSKHLVDLLVEHGEEVTYTEQKISLEKVQHVVPEMIISYNHKHILGPDILQAVDGWAINLHISYLPYNRGAYPNIWSFLEDTPKGVTIHNIGAGIDTGDIMAQKQVYIDIEKETFKSAYEILHQEIQFLFKANWEEIKSCQLAWKLQGGGLSTSSGNIHCLSLSSREKDGLSQSRGFGPGTCLDLRKVTENDKGVLFQWRNDPMVRNCSFSTHIIACEEHERWFDQKLKSPDVVMYMGYLNNEKIGTIRFETDVKRTLVSVVLNPAYIGKGFGASLIKEGSLKFIQESQALTPIIAEIKSENIASVNAFLKAGYQHSHVTLMYQVPEEYHHKLVV